MAIIHPKIIAPGADATRKTTLIFWYAVEGQDLRLLAICQSNDFLFVVAAAASWEQYFIDMVVRK